MLSVAVMVAALATAPLANSSPAPCPSASPAAKGTVPSPCAGPPLPEIGRLTVGRKANAIGRAGAASEGTVDQEQIATRPLLRPGDLLEAIPGLVISQHSGEGKANQYYLRGFQLDHGTDLQSTIVGMPINLPTHAHGQGYSDVNWLIPELVSYVEFKKGPYYAEQGDFSTAGAYNLYYRNTIAPTVAFGTGQYGYDRFLLAASPKVGSGNLLYALEVLHDNSTFVKPDGYQRLNGVLRWSRATDRSDFNVTLAAYQGLFNSTDQIPQRLVDAGLLARYGSIDPSDGGSTYRYSLSTQWQHSDSHGTTKLNAFGYRSYLDLFSNFTYFLDDATDYYNLTRNPVTCSTRYNTCVPGVQHAGSYTSYCPGNSAPAASGGVAQPFSFSCGDQREQQDIRFVSGLNVSRSFETPASVTAIGAGTRNDNIGTVGLFLTNARARYPNGTLSNDHVVERDANIWAQTQVRVGRKLRLVGGLRGDLFNFSVYDPDPANSGRTVAAMVNPKFTAAYAFSPHQEAYGNFGGGFHSNDARGIFQTVDPQTHAGYDSTGAPVQQVTPLVRAAGAEFGYRVAFARITSTIAFWQLNINSELVFDGDHGTTTPGGPTVRRGIELTNFWTPSRYWTFDADFATSTARFTSAAPGTGTGVPESLNAVIGAGVTVDRPEYAASLRMRYFGPRVLDRTGDAISAPSLLFGGQLTAKFKHGFDLTLDGFNLFNAGPNDVQYFYGSWLPRDAANPALGTDPAVNPALGGGGVNDFHFHPSVRQTFRITASKRL